MQIADCGIDQANELSKKSAIRNQHSAIVSGLCFRRIEIHGRKARRIHFNDGAKLRLELFHGVGEGKKQAFGMLRGEHDAGFDFRFWQLWHHPDKIQDEFGV